MFEELASIKRCEALLDGLLEARIIEELRDGVADELLLLFPHALGELGELRFLIGCQLHFHADSFSSGSPSMY